MDFPKATNSSMAKEARSNRAGQAKSLKNNTNKAG
jgi:hypothetical protein